MTHAYGAISLGALPNHYDQYDRSDPYSEKQLVLWKQHKSLKNSTS